VISSLVETLFVERMDQNEELFMRFMNHPHIRKEITSWVASETYRRIRETEGNSELPMLRLVRPRAEERYFTALPLIPLKAAAGGFGDPQYVPDEQGDWVAVQTRHRLRPGMFVAQVVGRSMEPAIPDGSYCIFAAPVTGTRQGKTVLVQLADAVDPETGQRYTVKRYESRKVPGGDSWRHETITLRPLNPAFESIVLNDVDEDSVRVVAELIEVLRA
jgi:SOS-response transcriptional repressor LexA